jgi:hypothetical protein
MGWQEVDVNEQDILKRVNELKRDFDPKREFGRSGSKFSGAITVEVIREALQNEGIPVSPRDVFIKGVPIEIDLLIPSPSATQQSKLLYAPEGVLAVLEIKNAGSFGEKTITTTRDNFKRIKQIAAQALCCYVALAERRNFKDAVKDENISPFRAYTLFEHDNSGKKYEPSGDWQKLLADLKRCLSDV